MGEKWARLFQPITLLEWKKAFWRNGLWRTIDTIAKSFIKFGVN